MMYKILLIKFFLTVILILSSCSYNEIEVRKKNIQAYKSNKLILYTNKKLDAEFRKEKAKNLLKWKPKHNIHSVINDMISYELNIHKNDK